MVFIVVKKRLICAFLERLYNSFIKNHEMRIAKMYIIMCKLLYKGEVMSYLFGYTSLL